MLANGIRTSAFALATSAISSFEHPRLAGERLRVDREHHGHHPPLAVVLRELDRRGARRLAAEVLDGRVAQLVGKRVASRLRHLDVGVHVDRDDILEREALGISQGGQLRRDRGEDVERGRVEERVPAGDGVHRLAAEDALDGCLELLSRQRARDRGHVTDRVGYVAR